MVTKPRSALRRRAFRWRLLAVVLGLIALDRFMSPAQAASPATTATVQAALAIAGITGLLR